MNSEQQQFEHNKNIDNSSETQNTTQQHKFQRVGEIRNVKSMIVALEVARMSQTTHQVNQFRLVYTIEYLERETRVNTISSNVE